MVPKPPYSLGSVVPQSYLVALVRSSVVVRSVLEPRLVGRQLGLDPLVTLAAFYAGYRLWGILGMILAPICAAAARSFFAETESQ